MIILLISMFIKKSKHFWIFLVSLLFLLILSSLIIAQPQQGAAGIFSTLFDALFGRGFDLSRFYSQYGQVIDFILYSLVFVSLSYLTLGRIPHFSSRPGKVLAVAMGLIMSVAVAVWTAQTGFQLIHLGPLVLLMFFLIAGFVIYELIKYFFNIDSLTGKTEIVAIVIGLIYFLFGLMSPETVEFISNIPVAGPLLIALFPLFFIIALIALLMRVILKILNKFKGMKKAQNTAEEHLVREVEKEEKEEEESVAEEATEIKKEEKKLEHVLKDFADEIEEGHKEKALEHLGEIETHINEITQLEAIQDQNLSALGRFATKNLNRKLDKEIDKDTKIIDALTKWLKNLKEELEKKEFSKQSIHAIVKDIKHIKNYAEKLKTEAKKEAHTAEKVE